MKWIRKAAYAVVLGLACTIAPAHVDAAQESMELQTVLAEDSRMGSAPGKSNAWTAG